MYETPFNALELLCIALHCSAAKLPCPNIPEVQLPKTSFIFGMTWSRPQLSQLAVQPYGVLLTHKRLTRYQCLICWTALIYVPVHFRVASNRISDSRTPHVLHELLRSFACIASYITANKKYECKTISTWEFLIPGARGLLPTTHWACKSCKELLNRAQTLWRQFCWVLQNQSGLFNFLVASVIDWVVFVENFATPISPFRKAKQLCCRKERIWTVKRILGRQMLSDN